MAELDLKEKMNDWGPWEEKESKCLIFSVGNPNEGHGYAMPRNIDDLHAKKAAHDLEFTTGQRHVAHIPYTTDRCGPVAKAWAPAFIPFEEFLDKSIQFMKYHINLIKERGDEISLVLLLTGHGGNAQLLERKYQKLIEKELEVKKFRAVTALVDRKDAGVVLEEVKKLANEMINTKGTRFGFNNADELADFYFKILLSAGHASHAEHSLAAALNVLDMKKVEIMNELLSKDFEAALRKWPAIGGLGGYLLAGGKYTEALGTEDNDKFGLWNCLKGLREINEGKLVVAPELGHLIHDVSLKIKTTLIYKYI
ncbi:MAG: hypothetical protein ACTSXH_13760 [Promethearchaeota archaeon]